MRVFNLFQRKGGRREGTEKGGEIKTSKFRAGWEDGKRPYKKTVLHEKVRVDRHWKGLITTPELL